MKDDWTHLAHKAEHAVDLESEAGLAVTCRKPIEGMRRRRTDAPLIRARSVVQVHPGPPFKSPVNMRLFSLFPFTVIHLQKTFCQKFAKSSGRLRPPSSGMFSGRGTRCADPA